MTSERQKAANQANALHSTGPKTPEGKAAVRFNAVRHGLLSRDVVLPGEDMDAFEDLRNQVWADLSPVGPIEEFHVDRIVTLMWKLQRLARAETALLDSRMRGLKGGPARKCGLFLRGVQQEPQRAAQHVERSRPYERDGEACTG